MVWGGLCLLGGIALFTLPVNMAPGVNHPGLTVETEYKGLGPRKLEELITRPIEEAVARVGGIQRLYSVTEEGKSRVHLEFGSEADLDLKALEIRERISLVSAGFPREAQKPAVLRYDPSHRPVFIVMLDSPESAGRDLSELREIAERDIKKVIQGIAGVGEVIIAGGQNREIQILCDRQRLEAYGVQIDDLMSVLQAHNINTTVGKLKRNGGEFSVYSKGRFKSIHEIRNLVLFRDKARGRVILNDVATVDFAFREKDSASRYNGKERVGLYIHRSSGANLPRLSDALRLELEKLKRPDLDFQIIYDQAESIRSALWTVVPMACLALVPVGLILFLLGFAPGRILIVLSMPLPALLVLSFFLFLFDLSFNLVNINGLVFGTGISLFFLVGLLVEQEREGEIDSNGRGVRSAARLSLPLVLLIAAAFLPLAFAGSNLRIIYGGLALTVLLFLVLTLLASITLAPVLTDRLPARYLAPVNISSGLLANSGRRLSDLLYKRGPEFIARPGVFRKSRPGLIFVVYIFCVVLGVFLYVQLPKNYMTNLEGGRIQAQIEFPSGAAFDLIDLVTRKIEKKVTGLDGVESVSSRVNAGQSTLTIKLKSGARATAEFLSYLRNNTKGFKPAFVHYQLPGGGNREISVDVLGENLKELDKYTRSLAKKAGAMEGVSNLVLRYKPPRPELQILINKNRSGRSGLSSDTIGRHIRYAIAGGVATKFIERNRELDVRLRYQKKFRDAPKKLRDFTLRNSKSEFVPLPEIASFKRDMAPVKIYRKNKKRGYSFSFYPAGGDISLFDKHLAELKNTPLPEGFRIEPGHDFQKLVKTRGRFLLVLGGGLLLVYMLLAAFYESLKKPLFLFPILPPALTGTLLALFVFGQALSLPVFIGLILLLVITLFQGYLWNESVEESRGRYFKQEERNRLLRLFLLVSLLNMFYCLPFVLLPGENGGLLRGIALVLFVGVPLSSVFTPILSGLIYDPSFISFVKTLRTTYTRLMIKHILKNIKTKKIHFKGGLYHNEPEQYIPRSP